MPQVTQLVRVEPGIRCEPACPSTHTLSAAPGESKFSFQLTRQSLQIRTGVTAAPGRTATSSLPGGDGLASPSVSLQSFHSGRFCAY